MSELLDLTEPRPSLTVGVDVSPAYDLLLTLWLLEGAEDIDTFDLGREWFEEVRQAMSTELREELAEVSSSGGATWIVLLGLVNNSPDPHDLDAFFSWLEEADGVELRKAFLSLKCHDLAEEQLVAGARGDQNAIEEALSGAGEHPEWKANLTQLLEVPSEELGPRLAGLLSRFRDEAYSQPEKQFSEPIARDSAAKSALIPTTSATRMIELSTNGVEYEVPSHVQTLLLAPSVVIRPWSLLAEHNSTYVLCYPVADEFLTTDPDSPPQSLINAYKALSDDRRLRILHRLSTEDATLQELADHLDVAKSTVHHHIGLLRAAGLVRVKVQGHKEQSLYGLRREAFEEAMRLMNLYLANAKPIDEVGKT
ncbi:MAG: ArsR/SmtB family transcription factor [Acidimicrobiia bacterium]